jgi:hypothetical protein
MQNRIDSSLPAPRRRERATSHLVSVVYSSQKESFMGFFDALRRVLTGEHRIPDAQAGTALEGDRPRIDAPTPGPEVYDRVQWQKKLKRILSELPDSQPEWTSLLTEARALGFEPDWIHDCQLEEFRMLIRQAVADRHVTETEHRKLDLARDLIGLAEAEAEKILHAIVAEAEAFFGKPVKED